MATTRAEAAREHWPIHWMEVMVQWPAGRGRNRRVTFGICGKTARIFTVQTYVLQRLVIHDVNATETACEEGGRCFNTDCALNRTTPKTLARALGLKRVPSWLKDVHPVPIDADFQARIDTLCRAHPDQGVLSVCQPTGRSEAGR